MSLPSDLERFRKKWKQELKSSARANGSRSPSPCAHQDDQAGNPGSNKEVKELSSPSFLTKFVEWKTQEKSDKVACETDRERFIESRNKRLKLTSSVSSTNIDPTASEAPGHNFLDIFLSDLEEINEIPFFDLELPRELAIKIFFHLDPLDLCRCSQVSRAWKSIAEDELLWSKICCRLGYEETATTREKSNWKEIVKQHVTIEKQMRQNWKTRTGEIESLEYVQGGVLCAVSSHQHTIAAGYSSGMVNVWDISADCNYTLSPSTTALAIDEDADAGTVGNVAQHICLNENLVAAGYSQGNIDVWKQGRKKKDPVHTFVSNKTIKHLKCVPNKTFLASAGFTDLWIHRFSTDNTSDTSGSPEISTSQILMEGDIAHLCIIPAKQSDENEGTIAIALNDKVLVHCTNDQKSMTKLHHVINHHITKLDVNSTHIAIGIRTDESPRLKLYDLESCIEINTLSGHTLDITAINLVDSPPNSLVTGSCDRRVRVYDTRLEDAVIVLRGHSDVVRCVQMDDWKVVSGSGDGMVCVWDQRMAEKLWEQHNRHPVKYIKFKDQFLYAANIPSAWDQHQQDPYEMLHHKRFRGTLSAYNFSINLMNPSLPSNVFSTYDEPEGYNYNIGLTVPYDLM